MRIAILGAGNAGSCAALELASRGLSVDLYDENDSPVRRASFHNEGKVHLGILYARDPSLRTARLMLEGAFAFAPLLRRWTGLEARDTVFSTPFFYAVHEGTMSSPDELKAHYGRCAALFDDAIAAGAEPYLGLDRSMAVEEVGRDALASLVEPSHFVTAFRTTERAVDPRVVAARVRDAVLAEPRIRFVGKARVTGVALHGRGGIDVSFTKDGAPHVERYGQVANALWHGRLEVDRTAGLAPCLPWSHRYKFANRVFVPLRDEDLPSVTCVLGPFGDVVNYGGNGLFLSWYPEGMVGTSTEVLPPDWESLLSAEDRRRVFRRSLEAWLRRCPRLRGLRFEEKDVDPGGGVIFAWGDTDVDDPASKLHDRYEPGVVSTGGYHSVNTGKYTLSPLMGLRTAERILGLS